MLIEFQNRTRHNDLHGINEAENLIYDKVSRLVIVAYDLSIQFWFGLTEISRSLQEHLKEKTATGSLEVALLLKMHQTSWAEKSHEPKTSYRQR